MRICTLIILFSFYGTLANAQSAYVPLGSYSMHILDRMEIKQGHLSSPQEFNTTTKAYLRKNIALYADSFNTDSTPLSKQDMFNLQYLQDDNFEYSNSTKTKTQNNSIYKHKAALYDVTIPDLNIVINPIVYLKYEYDQQLAKNTYINTRGLEIRGSLGKNIGFYTMLSDEIQQLNTWNQEFYNKNKVVAGQAFLYASMVKPNDSTVFNYWLSNAYISVKAGKYIDFQFGHGRNFIGNGYRSFMLSDFSTDNLFLRMNTRIWKINYTNIWGYLYDYSPFTNRNAIKRHYYATTHASINFTKKLNVGFYQTISFQRDSGFSSSGYDPQYLNPIIFYKPIENALNSPDKALIGFDFKYNFAHTFSLYGQTVISELNLNERFSGKGWWGIKEAYQLGIKYIDALSISNFDLQLEYNQASPYMYTSFDAKNAFVNYNQSMTHPIGANFREGIVIIKYQPLAKLFVNTHFSYAIYGNDTNGSNWGKDISISYNTRQQEYHNYIGQGVSTQLFIGEMICSYMIWHNMFIDFQLTYRNVESALPQFKSQTLNAGVAFRWNIAARQCNF